MKQTTAPATNDLSASDVMESRFPGINALIVLIIIPTEPGFEKPQIAYVAIASVRFYTMKYIVITSISIKICTQFNPCINNLRRTDLKTP